MPRRMSQIKTHEVSLVKRAANRKRFAVAKSESTMDPLIEAVMSTPVEGEQRLVATWKAEGLSDKEVAARVAKNRMEVGFADLLPDDDAVEPVAKGAMKGYAMKMKKMMDRMQKGMGEDEMMKMAEEMKAMYSGMMEDDKAMGRGDDMDEDEKMKKTKKSLGGDAAAIVELVTKAMQPMLEAKNQEVETLKSTVAELLAADRESVFTAKAEKEYRHVPAAKEEIAQVLKSAHDVSPDVGAQIEKILTRVNEAVSSAPILKSLGSTGAASGGGGDAWGKINALAEQFVQKSDDPKMTLEKARTIVLKTQEGKRLYEDYLYENPAQRANYGHGR